MEDTYGLVVGNAGSLAFKRSALRTLINAGSIKSKITYPDHAGGTGVGKQDACAPVMKEILLEQFTAAFAQNTWFVALKNTLEGVTAADAVWKPEGVDNSIWEIVSHLNYYNYAYVERFRGVDYQYPSDDNDATFVSGEATEEAWEEETTRLDAILNEFRSLIATANESKFEEPVSATNPAKWRTLISNISAHNAHHGGQIVLLRKMQGSWDRAKGVS